MVGDFESVFLEGEEFHTAFGWLASRAQVLIQIQFIWNTKLLACVHHDPWKHWLVCGDATWEVCILCGQNM